MTEQKPVNLRERRWREMQHIGKDDLPREFEVLKQELAAQPEPTDEEFDERAREMLQKHAELLSRTHTDTGDLGVAFFGLIEAAYIDKEQWAMDELDRFLGDDDEDEDNQD